LIVEARFYEALSDELLRGAEAQLAESGARSFRITVPGALEIPQAIVMALDCAVAEGRAFDGVVALGCVIRGETSHYETVANESARGLMDIALARGIPLGNGILTVENEDQAWARARVGEGDKGGAAAEAALSLIRTRRRLVALLREA
jgi:6,7-dimethyl-8-ribityllumazine synthase